MCSTTTADSPPEEKTVPCTLSHASHSASCLRTFFFFFFLYSSAIIFSSGSDIHSTLSCAPVMENLLCSEEDQLADAMVFLILSLELFGPPHNFPSEPLELTRECTRFAQMANISTRWAYPCLGIWTAVVTRIQVFIATQKHATDILVEGCFRPGRPVALTNACRKLTLGRMQHWRMEWTATIEIWRKILLHPGLQDNGPATFLMGNLLNTALDILIILDHEIAFKAPQPPAGQGADPCSPTSCAPASSSRQLA